MTAERAQDPASPDGPRIRILINGLHAKSGGGVIYLRNMLPRLAADSRLDLHLLVHSDQRTLFAPVDGRVRTHVARFRSGFTKGLLWEQLALPRLARALGADVTYSPANFGPIFAPNPVILLRNSLAVADVDPRLSKRIYWAALRTMTALSVLGCRRAIAVSEYARRNLLSGLTKRAARKTVLVHHGVDDAFRADPETSGSRDGAGFLLAVGDIYVQKNLHSLIAALPLVRATTPDVLLRIAGHPVDNDYYHRLRKEVADRNLENHVEFLGRLETDALIALYRSCAVFVFPSTVETFGNPLLEAMACGAPIACSNTTAMPEVVGDAALQFDPGDTDDIARAIVRLLRDPDLATTLRTRGMRRAALFSWERAARLTGDVLVSAADRSSAKRHLLSRTPA